MPFTNSWSDAIPLDTQLADLIGSDIRQLRQDIHERMTSVVVKDWTTDPLVLQDSVSGLLTGGLKVIPFTAFINTLAGYDTAAGLVGGEVGAPIAAPLDIPAGCTITLIEWLTDILAATSVTCYLKRRPFASSPGAVGIIVNTPTIAAAGINVVASTALAHLVDANYYYWLELDGAGTTGHVFRHYATRITFNRPSTAAAT